MDTGEIRIYHNQDGNIKIDVRLEEETVWLTIDQMAEPVVPDVSVAYPVQ